MNPSPRRVFFKGFLCCLRQPGGFATLRQKAGKSNMPVCICFLRCVPAVFMLCIKYHQETTCDMHRPPDRVRPSLRLILSGSGNTAWEQVSDQGCHNRVCNIYVLFSLSVRQLIFYTRTCPQQVRPASLQGVLPALQAKLSLRCGKSRQRQMHLFF